MMWLCWLFSQTVPSHCPCGVLTGDSSVILALHSGSSTHAWHMAMVWGVCATRTSREAIVEGPFIQYDRCFVVY